jgi:hypothetical protein
LGSEVPENNTAPGEIIFIGDIADTSVKIIPTIFSRNSAHNPKDLANNL